MKKIVSVFIFIGIIIATFCSSGGMSHTMAKMMNHDQLSECCDYEAASSHHTEETIAVVSLFNDFAVTAAILILVFLVAFPQNQKPSFQGEYFPYFFHKFSRGVFQLE